MNKKVILFILLFIIFGIIGYFIFNKVQSNNELEREMKRYSEDYFTKYVSTKESMSAYKITLDMIQNSSENYDLKKLEKCDKNKTYSNIFVDYNTGLPKKIEVKLNC